MSLSAATIDAIWDQAKTDTLIPISEHYLGYGSADLEPKNPYLAGTDEAEEYAAAFEHFIMTALGY